jgi:predicted acylesterase/phospholipase RssA
MQKSRSTSSRLIFGPAKLWCLSKGPAAAAILASAAIPPAFAPVKFERLYLAEGAISSNTPVKVAVALGAQRLIIGVPLCSQARQGAVLIPSLLS